MHVGIQESEHFEGVYPVIRLFDNGHNKLFLFVNRYVYDKLLDLLGKDAQHYHWVIQEEGESTLHFCRRMRQVILSRNIQLVYLNTISKHHLWYAWYLPFSRCSTILTVHDVNCLFKAVPGYTPRSFAQYLGKKRLRNKVSAFNTVSDTVKPYLQSLAQPNQAVYTIPGAVYERTAAAPSGLPPLRIVVPGSIDGKRRDYHAVLALAKMLEKDPVQIILLGGGQSAYAQKIWQLCANSGLSNLLWFEQAILSQDIFDQWLDNAHFIWIPSVINTEICEGIPEVYGITKSSGNIFDIIKHARPFLYPDTLVVPDAIQSSGYSYSNLDSLVQQVRQIISQPEGYARLLSAANEASGSFTISRLRARFSEVFG